MIPNCMGCEVELFEALQWLDWGYDVSLDGFGERRHLLIAVFDKKGNIVLF